MGNFLKYIGCIQDLKLDFKDSLEEFNHKLKANLDPRYIKDTPMKATKSYNGLIAGNRFEVNENLTFFGTNWHNADLSGKVENIEQGISVHITSHGFKLREVLFLLAGILIMSIGIYQYSAEPRTDNIVMIIGGITFIVFPFLLARKAAKKTLDNFQFYLYKFIKETSRQQDV